MQIKLMLLPKKKKLDRNRKKTAKLSRYVFKDRVLSSFLVTKIAKKNISKKRLDIDIGKQGFTKS